MELNVGLLPARMKLKPLGNRNAEIFYVLKTRLLLGNAMYRDDGSCFITYHKNVIKHKIIASGKT